MTNDECKQLFDILVRGISKKSTKDDRSFIVENCPQYSYYAQNYIELLKLYGFVAYHVDTSIIDFDSAMNVVSYINNSEYIMPSHFNEFYFPFGETKEEILICHVYYDINTINFPIVLKLKEKKNSNNYGYAPEIFSKSTSLFIKPKSIERFFSHYKIFPFLDQGTKRNGEYFSGDIKKLGIYSLYYSFSNQLLEYFDILENCIIDNKRLPKEVYTFFIDKNSKLNKEFRKRK